MAANKTPALKVAAQLALKGMHSSNLITNKAIPLKIIIITILSLSIDPFLPHFHRIQYISIFDLVILP